jgi:hypothetical protein
MRLVGCDLHASQQSIAMLDRDTGEIVERTLTHEDGAVREFYAAIPPPVVVGIEATGSMGWFLRLMEELAIECRVGHPTAIRKAETRRQKHDRRDAALLLQLSAEDRLPAIWMPSTECPGRNIGERIERPDRRPVLLREDEAFGVVGFGEPDDLGPFWPRLLTDITGEHYTIVGELTFENLAAIDQMMPVITGETRWQAAYQKFVPCVESGHREIFKLVE